MGEKNGIVIRKGQEIKIAEIPSLVQRQTDEIKSLKYKVDVAVTKAEQATKRAKETSEMSTGFGKKKAAIEDLQKTAVEFAEAQSVLAEAQSLFPVSRTAWKYHEGPFWVGNC